MLYIFSSLNISIQYTADVYVDLMTAQSVITVSDVHHWDVTLYYCTDRLKNIFPLCVQALHFRQEAVTYSISVLLGTCSSQTVSYG